jgi:hypothetical protein
VKNASEESLAMQFYQQARRQFEAWSRDPACDLDPGALRECVADCDKAIRELRERDGECLRA